MLRKCQLLQHGASLEMIGNGIFLITLLTVIDIVKDQRRERVANAIIMDGMLEHIGRQYGSLQDKFLQRKRIPLAAVL